MSYSKRAFSAGLLALVVSLAKEPSTRAKEDFPRRIAQHLGAATDPPCGLCHEYGKTGKDTLVTPFAWAMRARGMSGGNSVIEALDRVAADKVDSDGDGALDVDEIKAGTDPNSAASTPLNPGTVPDPQLGCAVAGVHGGQPFGWVLVGAALGLTAWRRPRRRSVRGCK